ncbi:MAG: phosphoribosyl-ATP pyrophosphohydrolase [Candidatus Heimdallarchaeota archaeon]
MMPQKEYDKLVRDNIPKIIEKQGKIAITKKAKDSKEFLFYLGKKLVEESLEFEHSASLEELVDILEVLLTILKTKDKTLNDLDKLRQEKNLARGSFTKQIILLTVRG